VLHDQTPGTFLKLKIKLLGMGDGDVGLFFVPKIYSETSNASKASKATSGVHGPS
jgi:hypothetical protein